MVLKMGTPGLLSIVSDSVVKYKVFVTCNGMMVSDLALKLAGKDFADMTCRGLYNLAMEASFGCESCLVVVGGNGDIATESDISIHIFYSYDLHFIFYLFNFHYSTAVSLPVFFFKLSF